MADSKTDTTVTPLSAATLREKGMVVQLLPVTRIVSRPSVQIVDGQLVAVFALSLP